GGFRSAGRHPLPHRPVAPADAAAGGGDGSGRRGAARAGPEDRGAEDEPRHELAAAAGRAAPRIDPQGPRPQRRPARPPPPPAPRDSGRPDHALWTRAPGFDRPRAAAVFLARAAKDRDYPWSADLVKLLDSLPQEKALPVLRKLWDNAGLNEVMLPLLARHPH